MDEWTDRSGRTQAGGRPPTAGTSRTNGDVQLLREVGCFTESAEFLDFSDFLYRFLLLSILFPFMFYIGNLQTSPLNSPEHPSKTLGEEHLNMYQLKHMSGPKYVLISSVLLRLFLFCSY